MRAVTTLALAVTLAGCSPASDQTRPGEPTTAVVEPTTDASIPDRTPTASAVDRLDIEVAEHGWSAFTFTDGTTNASWAAVVRNPNPDAWLASSIDLTVTSLDASGSVLSSESGSVALLLPGQDAAVAGVAYEVEGVQEVRVQARVRNWEESEGPFGGFTTSGVNVREDRWGGWTVTGTVESDFERDFEDVQAVAVLRDSAGVILGGGSVFLDFVPAGGDTSAQVRVTEDLEDVVAADLFVSLTNLSLYAS